MKTNWVFLIVLVGIAASNILAFDKTYELTKTEFDDLTVLANGITLNNFSIAEESAFLAQGTHKVSISFSVRNKTTDSKAFTTMIVGMSNSTIIWALDASPMMYMVSGNTTEECTGSAYVTQGTVAKTTKIWIRIVGDF